MSGWTNQGITTLVIPTGATTGARVVIDGTTGQISVYNSSNQLVGQWGGANGCFFSFPLVAIDTFVEICEGIISWGEQGFTPADPPSISSNGITINSTGLQIQSGQPTNNGVGTFLELFGGQTAAGAEIRASQRNITGDLVQLDTTNNAGQLVHGGLYSGTVSGGDGHWTFPHGCSFTPSRVDLTPYAAGGGDGPGYVRLWTNALDGTNCFTIWRDDGGGITANGTTVGVHATFWG
jgi:hypothetical protein